MGKLKRKNWQYCSKEPVKANSNGLSAAVYLASYEWNARKKAREIMAVDDEVKKAADTEYTRITNEFTDWDFGCAALVLHRMYGKDADECAKFLTEMQSLIKEFQETGMYSKDIWDVVRDEIGLDIETDY